MKFLLSCMVAFVAIGVVSSGRIGSIIGLITDIVDLSLSIGNVISGGCIYYADICTYQKAIDAMEVELAPKFKVLDNLDKGNAQLYADMTDILAFNNDLGQQSGNLQFLVISITRKLGNSAQTYEKLAEEFEARTNTLLTTYKAEVEAIKKAAISKTILLGVVDAAKLLYHGLKFSYNKLKKEGIISGRNPLDFRKAATGTNTAKLALRPLTNPRFNKAKNQFAKIGSWWNKPSFKKLRGHMAEAGIVIGSLFSLGVSVTVDVLMAKKMRDTLKTTHDELVQIKNSVDGYISSERAVNDNLQATYVDSRKSFSELTQIIEDTAVLKGIDSSRILRINNAGDLKKQQIAVIDAYVKLQTELQAMDLNAEIQSIIKIGVEWGDSLRRISMTIDRAGFGPVTIDQILYVIDKEFPKLSTYDGQRVG